MNILNNTKDIINTIGTKDIVNTIGEIISIVKKTFKKPLFITRDGQIIKINKFLNSYGNFGRFWQSFFITNDDINVLRNLYFSITEEDKYIYQIYYCLVGKLGTIKLICKSIKYFYNYFKSRDDLNLIVRIVVTWKKTVNYTNKCNYNTCIDVFDYFNNKDYYDVLISKLFYSKEIDRINLYMYTIEKNFK